MPEKHGYTASKEQLLKRLARIEGQVRGVSRMVEEDRYCIDVITQIQASEAALEGVALGLLDDHVRNCMDVDAAERSLKTDELMGAVGRLVRG
ncbi:MAG: CsoR family transcriptional regulator, copper-sensing transcriptional repressor [Solirubrobacterales bacterium]|jgi:DNA-binding FrmR family transcriptional regulator|nr:CsoR family transcriptional regulator, copper-sensing transcriptional repressor [Solirubrobacterales bacterium]